MCIYFFFQLLVTISEVGKRKKLKSRNTAANATTALPTNILPTGINSGYSKDHLDAWLETCLKDASTTQLSSSSEFLDYNPSSNIMSSAATSAATAAAMSVNNLNQKNMFPMSVSASSQQQQQQPSVFNMTNLQQQQAQQQQQFAMRTNPLNNGVTNNNMPNNNSFNNPFPFSQGFQRVSTYIFM